VQTLGHDEGLPQVPLEVHDSTLLPEHVVWPGAHSPMQAPLLQVWFTQAVTEPQDPLELHVCTPLPRHCVDWGVHATQVLLRHTDVGLTHVVAVSQLPEESHDWMALPRHCVWPGAQPP
jgi:hypothetical protein